MSEKAKRHKTNLSSLCKAEWKKANREKANREKANRDEANRESPVYTGSVFLYFESLFGYV